jgi:hypothetical protein
MQYTEAAPPAKMFAGLSVSSWLRVGVPPKLLPVTERLGYIIGCEMDARAAAQSGRPWWRLHVTTLFALAAVGSALGYCESRLRPSVPPPFSAFEWQDGQYGWPLSCLVRFTKNYVGQASLATTSVRLRSDVPAALLDFSAVVLMMLLTVAACELWRRRKLHWWQFSVRSFFVLTAVGMIVATMYSNNISVPWCRSELQPHGQTIYRCSLAGTPWYVSAAMLFGIGCAVFASGRAAWMIGAASWRLARRIGISHQGETVS